MWLSFFGRMLRVVSGSAEACHGLNFRVIRTSLPVILEVRLAPFCGCLFPLQRVPMLGKLLGLLSPTKDDFV